MDVVAVVRSLVVLLLIALSVILVTRRFSLPYTLGLVVVGLLISLGNFVPSFPLNPNLVLFVFLPALLFEGSWSMSVKALREHWVPIFLFSVPGLLLELILIALPLHFFSALSWIDALLLGAILSPTDPVAVLGLFRQLKVDSRLAVIIEGESLFNDGVAGTLYQVFLAFVLISIHSGSLTGGQLVFIGLETLLREAGGGILIGVICGFLISRFLKHIDDALIEITITIVAAYGVYILADFLHMSGILAVILAGLILGSYGQNYSMTDSSREAVDDFWNIIAFLANALVFLLVGVQLNPLQFFTATTPVALLLTAGSAIVAVLLARIIMVLLLPAHHLPPPRQRQHSWRFIIFWSGMRGALSLALVLALPLDVPSRSTLVFSTYAVILFTLLVQGFSLRFLLRKLPV